MVERLGPIWTILRTGSLTLPAAEIVLLLATLSACLLFRCSRTGLLCSYLFAYRWGWLVYWEDVFSRHTQALAAYVLFGLLVLFLAGVGMLRGDDER
jgi:hypothetical protein